MTLYSVTAAAEGMILYHEAAAAEGLIVVGELGGAVDPCIELRVSTTNLIMLQVFKLGNLIFPFGVFGGHNVTEGPTLGPSG